jgi:hypothetical protein
MENGTQCWEGMAETGDMNLSTQNILLWSSGMRHHAGLDMDTMFWRYMLPPHSV